MFTIVALAVSTLAAFLACMASFRNFAQGYVDRKVDDSIEKKLLHELIARVEILEKTTIRKKL